MLTSAQIYLASTAVRELRVSLSNFFLYTSGNTMVEQSLQKFLKSLEGIFTTVPSITLGESEGRLVVEGSPLDERTTGSTNMIKDLFLSHKLHSLTFFKGVEAQEVRTLFELLRPKALPSGLSLSQAMVQKSLKNLKANEKVFVAIQEGEKVVSASAAAGAAEPGEDNLQEALEALQYFLQVFTRVKPDNNKREVAKRMMDNMGGWLKAGAKEGSSSPASAEAKNWREVMGGFSALRDSLGTVKQPDQIKNAQAGMEELVRKLVALGEASGFSPASDLPEASVPTGAGSDGQGEGQASLFETDPVIAAFNASRWEIFWNPSLEEQVAKVLSSLQSPDRAKAFASLWKALWEKIFSKDAASGYLVLRQMNRLQWARLTRPLQVEGLRNLRTFLLETRDSNLYPVGLTLAQDWVPQEMVQPDWKELTETAEVLRELSLRKPPEFDKQEIAAQVAVETIFCGPVLQSLAGRWEKGGKDGQEILRLLRVLGDVPVQYFFEKVEQEELGSPAWNKAVDLLASLQEEGIPLWENWLGLPENQGKIGKFLEIFRRVPFNSGVADHIERHWNSFGTDVQLVFLELVEEWKRADFRPFLLNLLGNPEKPQAFQALKTLAKVGLEGDGESVVNAVRKYPSNGKDRDKFWIEACLVLGEIGDPASVEPLKEWGDKYKFLANKKERSMEVRKAALEALGHFKTLGVKTFLEGLRKDAEKELLPVIEGALKEKS